MILILTAPDDVHADAVGEKLEFRSASFVRFDPAVYPVSARITARTGRGSAGGLLEADEQAIRLPLETVSVVWYRRPGIPAAHRFTSRGTGLAVVEMAANGLSDVWQWIDADWVPARPDALRTAAWKLAQLRAAAHVGFEIPATLLTNDPDALIRFYREYEGQVVSKRVPGSMLDADESPFCRYTEPVGTRDIGYATAVRFSPLLIQAAVAKRLEVRVTVVGESVFPVMIDSQATNHTRYDWRRYDHLRTPYRLHELPPSVEGHCRSVTQLLGLRFSTIDLIQDPTGRYVFIELNPNGQFLWVEQATGLRIADAVAELLVTIDHEHDQ
jgi:MvdD-like protein with pre-ATP grasp domain